MSTLFALDKLSPMARLAYWLEVQKDILPDGVKLYECPSIAPKGYISACEGMTVFEIREGGDAKTVAYAAYVQGDFIINGERKVVNSQIVFDLDKTYGPAEIKSILEGAGRKLLHFKETVLEKKA